MRLVKLTFSIFFLLFGVHAFSQKQNVYLFKNDGRLVQSRDSADYIRIVSEPDSGSVLFNVHEYYTSGKIKSIGKSLEIDPPVLEGQMISFYPSGLKKTVINYDKNKLTGTSYKYYPNGKIFVVKQYKTQNPGHTAMDYLIITAADSTGKATVTDGNGYYVGYNDDFKSVYEEGAVKNGENEGDWKGYDKGFKTHFIEHYENGKLTSGVSTDSAGVTHQYQSRAIEPSFKGGIENFYQYLSHAVHYPARAKLNGIQGKVLISFVIKKNGQLKDIKILRSVSPEIDAEALRVMKLSPNWQPGMLLGMPVNVQYTMPLNFALSPQ